MISVQGDYTSAEGQLHTLLVVAALKDGALTIPEGSRLSYRMLTDICGSV